MSNDELKRQATLAYQYGVRTMSFTDAATPQTVLALLAEIERLKAAELVARDKALEEAWQACGVLARSYDNEHNRGLGVVADLMDTAIDCQDAIMALRSTDGEIKNG